MRSRGITEHIKAIEQNLECGSRDCPSFVPKETKGDCPEPQVKLIANVVGVWVSHIDPQLYIFFRADTGSAPTKIQINSCIQTTILIGGSK